MPIKDNLTRAQYSRLYANKHRDRLKKYRHDWYIINKDRIRERDSTPEKIKTKKQQNSEWRTKNRIRSVLCQIKNRAKKFNIEFNLSENDITIPNQCPIFHIPLFYTHGCKTANTPSVDRIDSSKGYIKGNVWVISWKANRLKNNATFDELIMLGDWAKNVVSNNRG